VNAWRVTVPPFPYRDARVFADRTLFSERTVWIEAGSPRHAAALSPAQLVRLTRAQTGDFAAEA
jgi:prolyl-tRNA editing enzyme YbaK/EbsC (Cys-tRNA(Pro) deacylase)